MKKPPILSTQSICHPDRTGAGHGTETCSMLDRLPVHFNFRINGIAVILQLSYDADAKGC